MVIKMYIKRLWDRRSEPSNNIVGLHKTDGYSTIYKDIEKVIELAGNMEISDGDKILIKINLCELRTPSSGAITHPLFLDALLRYLRNNFKDLDITVIESDATSSLPDIIIKWFGFDKIFKKWDVKWTNLSSSKKIIKEIRGLYFDKIEISDVFKDYNYFITAPKLKTHCITKMTACLKNQFGAIPYKRKVIYHKKLDEVIVDANLAMKPDFCIVDGIIAMCGIKSPNYGIPTKANLLIAGKDPVAVDSVCAKLFGFKNVDHILKAEKMGIGDTRFLLRSDSTIEDVRIDPRFPVWEQRMIKFAMKLKEIKG